jgi:hypothetical protein
MKQKAEFKFKVRGEELATMSSWIIIILAYVIIAVGVFNIVGFGNHPLLFWILEWRWRPSVEVVRYRNEEEDKMRHMMLTLFMMIAVGVFAYAEGRKSVDVKAGTVVQFVDLVETGQPRLVLIKAGTRQQEARQQNEGCQVIPNGDLSQHKTNEQDSSTMKGLVFWCTCIELRKEERYESRSCTRREQFLAD